MKKEDYTKHDTEALQRVIADKRESLRVIRFGGAGSRSRNVREAQSTRKEIARMLTELHSRNTVAKDAKKA